MARGRLQPWRRTRPCWTPAPACCWHLTQMQPPSTACACPGSFAMVPCKLFTNTLVCVAWYVLATAAAWFRTGRRKLIGSAASDLATKQLSASLCHCFSTHAVWQAPQLVPGLEYHVAMGVHILAAGCGAKTGLPTLALTLDGRVYALAPDQYIIQAPA